MTDAEHVLQAATPTGDRRLRLYTPAELLNFPDPEWLVEPFLIGGSLTILFGPSGTFKSFVAVDWAARAPGQAVYISAEGSPKALGARIAAWECAAARAAHMQCLPHSLNLLEQGGALAEVMRNLGEPVRLVVVDTAARNMAGGDENSPRDMGMLVSALDALRGEFGCAVLVIHHTGHENTDRERGSSALRGAADVSIRAKAEGARAVRLECAKMRDAEMFLPAVVRLEPVDGTLVAARAVSVQDTVLRAVAEYIEANPEASQREVEDAVKGRAATIRAAYQQLRPGASRASAPMDAPLAEVRPAAPLLRGTRTRPHDPTLDPDEHLRAIEDGGG